MTPLPQTPLGRPAPQHVGPEDAVFHGDVVDGAGFAGHAHGEAGALEGGASGGGAAGQLPLVPQGDLPVGADVGEKPGARLLADGAGQQGGGDVGPYKGGHAPGQVDLGVRAGQVQRRGGEGLPEEAGGLKRGVGEAVRVGGGEQVEHHRVAGDGDAVDLLWRDGGLGGHVPDELGEGPPHRGGQLRPLALEGCLDAGDHIGAPGPLGVGAAGLGQLDALLVEEEGSQGGGADVQGHAVVGKGGGPGGTWAFSR